ncbi:hypothetical protein AMK27_35215 [Streptomyces sp. CB02009]|uniref:hypothetical protein n=1 Tax=Streptomyces sp. CB02009 TaxID=1703938 RepID=UPI00093EBD9B|nr:hypothetical protein [Streptomyces sp. CB02009]OKJ50323.1 hypothetical protein AMK27_35215 [Streptomyces sp. CB02009]
MTTLKPVSEWRDVYDFLDQVRLRPGMFVRGGSLLELQAMLYGYRVASEIYGPQAMTDFEHQGPFAEWLWPRLGHAFASPLGWAVEITKAAEASGRAGIDLFFDLLSEFKAERSPEAR